MKKIKRGIRLVKDALTYVRVFSNKDEESLFAARRISHEEAELLISAKKLHAEVYLAKGFVGSEDIREDIIHAEADPHQHHADYFGVYRKGRLIAVARQIKYKGVGPHHTSFPVLSDAIIYARSRNRLENLHPATIVEISALAKKSGESTIAPLVLYRALWRHSIKEGHEQWIMACDVRLYERLKVLFGPALTRIGQQTPYRGGDVVPVSVNIPSSVKYIRMKAQQGKGGRLRVRDEAAKFMVKGLNQ